MAVEQEGCRVVFSNDIDKTKHAIYSANFPAEDFVCTDVRRIHGEHLPDVEIATASFPCVDLSLAGNRAGLAGSESGLFWEFTRVLDEMGHRRPPVLLVENVPGFATSHGGEDLRAAIEKLNGLGYSCDLLTLDARQFVPQSRLRLFIVGSRQPLAPYPWMDDEVRPDWLRMFAARHRGLQLHSAALPPAPRSTRTLRHVVQRIAETAALWWEPARLRAFLGALSPLQSARLRTLRTAPDWTYATAYRRTRYGRPMWEIRADEIAGCLRTTRGGSSKQAVVRMGKGGVRVRWMTAREYARLQGAPKLRFGAASESQARFALGDAVCVPAVAWLTRHYLLPLVQGGLGSERRAYA